MSGVVPLLDLAPQQFAEKPDGLDQISSSGIPPILTSPSATMGWSPIALASGPIDCTTPSKQASSDPSETASSSVGCWPR
jgi:hypothetical protein